MEEGEDPIEAAIRELKEETGIQLQPSDLANKEVQTLDKYNSKGDLIYVLTYFVYPINDPSDIGMTGTKIDKTNLQLEEIDWAGFVDINDAYPLIHRGQLILLDRLR